MSIGEQLRQAREQHNVSLHAIAEKTNISVRFLDAIEKGQIDKLPGGIFTRGFVRSYAGQVGLDPDETVRAFVAAHPEVRADDEVDQAESSTRAGAVAKVALLIAVLLAVVAGGVYWWLTRGGEGRPATQTSPTPDNVADPAAVPPAAQRSDLVPTSTPTPAPVATGVVAPPVDAVAAPAETPAASTMPLRLTVAPGGRCWVQVKADGRVRLAREVMAGERVDIEAAERLEIVAGDAGAFAYLVNGVPGRSLGVAGRVARATITADTLADYGEPRS